MDREFWQSTSWLDSLPRVDYMLIVTIAAILGFLAGTVISELVL